MTKSNVNLNDGAKCAVTSRTPRRNEGKLLSKVKELQRQLNQLKQESEEERNAKNKAYYFILSSGNFKKFAEFNEKHTANLDYHGACLAQIYLDSFKKN